MKQKGAEAWMIAFTIAVAILSAAILGGTNHAIAEVLGVADKINAITAGFRTTQAVSITGSTPNQQIKLSYSSTLHSIQYDGEKITIPVDGSDSLTFANQRITNHFSYKNAKTLCITSNSTVSAHKECNPLLCQTDACLTRDNTLYSCQGGALTKKQSREYSHKTNAKNCHGPKTGQFVTIDTISCPEAIEKDTMYSCIVDATYRCDRGQSITFYNAQRIPSIGNNPQTFEKETQYPCTGSIETISHTFSYKATGNEVTAITGYRSTSFTNEKRHEVLIR